MNMDAAVRLANVNQSHLEMKAAAPKKGMCACRGMCGAHTGPCSMKAAESLKNCKACAKGMKAKKAE